MHRDLATSAELGICNKCDRFPCLCVARAVKKPLLHQICDHCKRDKVNCNCASRAALAAQDLKAIARYQPQTIAEMVEVKDREVVKLYGEHDIAKIRKLVRELAEKAYTQPD